MHKVCFFITLSIAFEACDPPWNFCCVMRRQAKYGLLCLYSWDFPQWRALLLIDIAKIPVNAFWVGRYDRARGVEIGNKDIKLEHLEEAFTTSNWIVRIYKVKPPNNRWWDREADPSLYRCGTEEELSRRNCKSLSLFLSYSVSSRRNHVLLRDWVFNIHRLFNFLEYRFETR